VLPALRATRGGGGERRSLGCFPGINVRTDGSTGSRIAPGGGAGLAGCRLPPANPTASLASSWSPGGSPGASEAEWGLEKPKGRPEATRGSSHSRMLRQMLWASREGLGLGRPALPVLWAFLLSFLASGLYGWK
jgi:hypothetical protein